MGWEEKVLKSGLKNPEGSCRILGYLGRDMQDEGNEGERERERARTRDKKREINEEEKESEKVQVEWQKFKVQSSKQPERS